MDDVQRLNIGVLGLDRRGHVLLQAMAETERIHISAVAHRDRQRAETWAAQLNCEAFDDYRQFILNRDFDHLFVAANLHHCLEHVRSAIKDGCHLLKLAPMARTFAEADELYELSCSEDTGFDIFNPGRAMPSFQAFQTLVADGRMERPFLVRLFCEVGLLAGLNPELFQIHPDTQTSWLTDQTLAGGGVLLHHCYQLIDQLLLAFGLPRQVYALCQSHASDRHESHHLTEDTALITMRFGENLMADMVAMRHWDDRPARETIMLFDKTHQATILRDRFTLCNHKGDTIDKARFKDDPVAAAKTVLIQYCDGREDPRQHPFASDARANLNVMAVMEAAYLSARTGTPEDPARILERAKV